MKSTLQIVALLLAGGVAGAGIFWAAQQEEGGGGRRGARTASAVEAETARAARDQEDLIAQLRAEIERLRAELAAKAAAGAAEANPWPDDSPEAVERLMLETYASNNVDWLIEVIERLLRMGEKGYPLLRRLLEDIIFKAKFMPAQSDFRIDQLYKVGKVFTAQERAFIGFLNYLLLDANTNPWFKQGAMMGAAFYVGSNAPGSEQLSQTLVGIFLQQGGVMPGMGNIPMMGNAAKRMQVFAMAMSGDKQMIGPLRDELRKEKDKETQGDILGALAYLGDPGAVPLIQERLNPAEGDFRREIDALGRAGTEDAHKTASQFLRSIPDGKRFYQHAGRYVRAGGGASAVLLMKERVQSNPNDPEVGNAVGTLRRYPTKESFDTLVVIRDSVTDPELAKRAGEAAEEVNKRLMGQIPDFPR